MDKYEASVAQIMKMGDKEREEMVAIKKKRNYGIAPLEKVLNASGRNWDVFVQIVKYTMIWVLRNHISVCKALNENKGGCDL